jgi:hypothetical protein
MVTCITLAQAQGGCGDRTVDGRRHARRAGEVHRSLGDDKIDIFSRQHRRCSCRALADSRQSGANEGRQARQDTTGHKPLNESPPRRVRNGERER